MIFFLNLLFFAGVSALVQLFFEQSAFAWGPGVHTVTALSALSEASLLLPAVARVITAFPREYLYGCLAADFFIGKSKTKRAGHPHNWAGGFSCLEGSKDDQEAAFTYGILSHLAADVVAHNFFVPNLVSVCPTGRRRGHLYWEFKADYSIGPAYTKVAREILRMDHGACDELLGGMVGKNRNGFKAKKQVFTQSVKFSDYCHVTRGIFSVGKEDRWQGFHQYVAVMVELSCRLVKDFLSRPDSSPCLLYDPLGKENLRLARGKRFPPRFFSPRRPPRWFSIDQQFLDL